MVDSLEGADGDPGAATINVKNVDGRPPGECWWRSGSTHHQRKKCRRWDPWEVPELQIQKHPPSMLRIIDYRLLGR
jgi:hypothetical protein